MRSNTRDTMQRQRQKQFHRKVRTGCLGCRNGRVKCDETKPTCRRCDVKQTLCHYERSFVEHRPPKERYRRNEWADPITRSSSLQHEPDILLFKADERRFLAYYIMTADKLQRTARWIENMEGGIQVRLLLIRYLRAPLISDL